MHGGGWDVDEEEWIWKGGGRKGGGGFVAAWL